MYVYDVLIVGSGLAARMVAHSLPKGKHIAMLTKHSKWSSNSMLAQGGVAAVFSKEDHWSSHYSDTITAGCEHNDEQAVEYLVRRGPQLINELIRSGMRFDCNEQNEVLLGQEGAHTYRRILHAGGDATGKALVSFLYQKTEHRVDMMEYETVQELIIENGRCIGVRTQDEKGHISARYAQHVVLATGGCGSLYPYTSNTDGAIGEGLSLAYRAGAELADLEFIQFHPTLLVKNGCAVGLVSEAVRGEGAVLVTGQGERIMKGVHELEDLAPRDVVSREIYRRMFQGEQIFLMIKNVNDFTNRFPTITDLCEKNGVDLDRYLIPVMPGAHFHMGGIKVNMYGETSIPRLYAVGEAACTGVHGANRLASNSLLEGLVFGELAAKKMAEKPDDPIFPGAFSASLQQVSLSMPSKRDIQELMMSCVGIVRNASSLKRMVRLLEERLDQVEENIWRYDRETIKRIHMTTAAYLISKSAFEREESRGSHFRSDFPVSLPRWEKKQLIQERMNRKVNVIGG
ncbi:L-aspartate oxidase [Priestia abyssalis]|uniref:L-aspartate oxidase n=1 Tax=Priestia abyssalis TaxID=1221450 RepID=UPI000994DB13|nr:L-aspartate oxidase [Priestia abyssalis]